MNRKKSNINHEERNILVISHTCLSKNDSMGSTLAGYLSTFPQKNIYQFYIKKMLPNCFYDAHFYNWTDREATKNLFCPFSKRFKGTSELSFSEIAQVSNKESIINGANWGKRGAMLMVRHVVWSLSLRLNHKFKTWVKNINPKAVLLMPGDFQFVFKLAYIISNLYKIPIILMQCESYLLKPLFSHNPFYLIYRKSFAKWYKKIMQRVDTSIYLCNELCEDYAKAFPNSRHLTILRPYKIASIREHNIIRKSNTFIYAGNLGIATGRQEALCKLCEALTGGEVIDVFTNTPEEKLTKLSKYKNVRIHKFVDSNTLIKEYLKHEYIIHVENSTDDHLIDLKYAFSTKICDLMAYGCVGIAIGSSKIAGINYLKENKLAIVVEEPNNLSEILKSTSNSEKQKIVNNCKRTLSINHSFSKNANLFMAVIMDAMSKNVKL